MEQSDQLLAGILDIGEAMLEAGGEVSRVEKTLSLLCQAYGYTQINTYATRYSIIVTVMDSSRRVVTQTRRPTRWGTDMHRIERLNALSRQLCASTAPPEEIAAALAQIRRTPTYPRWMIFLVYLVAPLSLSLFFGGRLGDALASSLCGAVIWAVEQLGQYLDVKKLVHCFFCAITAGLSTFLVVRLFPTLQLDKVIIGDIMLLVPGLALTTSLRDIINGDEITGLLGFFDAILRAVIIAFGVALPTLLGGVL